MLSSVQSGQKAYDESNVPDTPQHAAGVSFPASERCGILGKLDFNCHALVLGLRALRSLFTVTP